jgi:peptidoglycan biosynthesis protein MviN/MurJ (putative lipid II flippase)
LKEGEILLEFIHTHETFFFWLTLIGFVGLIGSLIIVPWILIKIPSDYFYADKRKKCPWGHCPPIIRTLLLIIKNILGILLVLSGFIMLFIPGQGILTMIAGIVLMDFPYKYKMMRKVIKNSRVLGFINRLRKKADQEPLKI